jgi:hypothetical protein
MFIKETPANVVALIGERPSRRMQIDRKDNNLGYTCGQCAECLAKMWPLNIQWSNRMNQNRNKRNNVRFEYQGFVGTRGEIAEKFGKSFGWVRYNIG